MISTELETVWITSDGKKFFSKKEAEKHEQINKDKEKVTWLGRLQQNLK